MQTQMDFADLKKHCIVQGYRTRARVVIYFKNERCAEAFMRYYVNVFEDNDTP